MGSSLNRAHYLQQWKLRNPEKVAQYRETERQKYGPRGRSEQARKHYLKYRSKIIARQSAYQRIQNARDPEPGRVRALFNYWVRKGRYLKPTKCLICDYNGKLEAHHFMGYAREFLATVMWVCRSCHRLVEQP